MQKLMTLYERLLADEAGATAVEYVVIASVMGLALMPVAGGLGNAVQGLLVRVNGYFSGF